MHLPENPGLGVFGRSVARAAAGIADLNPESLTTVSGALAGPALFGAKTGDWCAAARRAHMENI